jgi:hypothetical protein
MRKTALATAPISALLLSTIAAIMLVNFAKANPMGLIPKELRPIFVTIQTPKDDGRVLRDKFTLTFVVKNPPLGGASSITYRIQGFTEVAIGPESYISSESGSFYTEYSNCTYSVTVNAAGLPDGWHSLAVTVSGKALYSPDQTGVGGVGAEIGGSDSIRFLFDIVPPSVLVLLPQNDTYATPNLPLNFTLSEEADWVGYSLDDQQPLVTIAGNTTIVGLSEGQHSLTVYANDTVGRKSNSETIYFNIKQESEEVVAEQTEPFPTLLAVAASVAVATVVALGVLVNWKKPKREAEPT